MNKGFTLLEMIITLVVSVLGVLALLQSFNAAMVAQHQTDRRMMALQLGQEKIEQVKSAGSYAGVDAHAAARMNLGGDFSDFDREVTVSGEPKEVAVTLFWGAPGDEQQLRLVTLIADYNF